MTTRYFKIVFLLSGLIFMLFACNNKPKKSFKIESRNAPLTESDQQLVKQASAVLGILKTSADNPENLINEDKVLLGKMLYFEPRLSKSGWISCNSCHNIATYGVDNLPTSIGHQWHIGDRNAPTTFNAAFHFVQFWDGRAKDVEEQAKGPVLNPGEMAAPHEQFAIDRIASIDAYNTLFKKAFPDESTPLNYNNIANAIGAFERTLIVPSRFDQFMDGNGDALNAAEKKGLQTFINSGCISCHMGATIGGTMYSKFGVLKDYWTLTGSKKKDEGRSLISKNKADQYFFKVPSLRNVERTYPYFHDGSVWELENAVAIMGETQLGKTLTTAEVNEIVTFLKSLTGELPKSAKEIPVLPSSSDRTSKPAFN